MSGLNVPPITEPALKLSEPMTELLGRVAGHKYAWSYVSKHGGEIQVADALVRRGLCEWGEVHGRDHWNSPQLAATDAGLALFRRCWPRSPAALERYEDSPFLATDWAGEKQERSEGEAPAAKGLETLGLGSYEQRKYDRSKFTISDLGYKIARPLLGDGGES